MRTFNHLASAQVTVKSLYGNVDVFKESSLIEQVGILSCRMGRTLKVYDPERYRTPPSFTKMVNVDFEVIFFVVIEGRTIARIERIARQECEKTSRTMSQERENILLKRKHFTTHSYTRMTQMKGIADTVDGKPVVIYGEERTQFQRPRYIARRNQRVSSSIEHDNDEEEEDFLASDDE